MLTAAIDAHIEMSRLCLLLIVRDRLLANENFLPLNEPTLHRSYTQLLLIFTRSCGY